MHQPSHPDSGTLFFDVALHICVAKLCEPMASIIALLPEVSWENVTYLRNLEVLICTYIYTPGQAASSKVVILQNHLPGGVWELTCHKQSVKHRLF